MFFIGINTIFIFLAIVTLHRPFCSALSSNRYVECGQYGFVCEGPTKLRLCEDDKLFGPAFNCPSNSVCNEDSSDVCENTINYVDPALRRTLRCHRHERIADPSVPGCKGYILCIPNNNRYQAIKFKCSGNTIFNGFTHTCSAPDRYKCPHYDSPPATPNLFDIHIDKLNLNKNDGIDRMSSAGHRNRPIDCKSYKFAVTQDNSPASATYFCPPRPVHGESRVRCTVFSNQFCITLERDDPDQFVERAGAAHRRPRLNNFLDSVYL